MSHFDQQSSHDKPSQEGCTAFVATAGGHVSELIELASRMNIEGRQVWITNDSPQVRDRLGDRQVEWVRFVGERDHLGVIKSIPKALQLFRKHRVTRVVSTGSALALGYLPLAKALGIDTHYIESSTRVESCSMTGRLLAKVPGVNCWWQFDAAPPGFRALGGVYDAYAPTERYPDADSPEKTASDPNPIQKIVVTIGTSDRCFRRLTDRLVKILPPEAEVMWQVGDTNVAHLDIDAHGLIPESELFQAMREADVVVAHAGAGTLALALQAGHVPVLIPRRAQFGELVDDHQVELANWAKSKGLAVVAEADAVTRQDITYAAQRAVVRKPVGKLVLT